MTTRFLARMEHILSRYGLCYDPLRPLLCIDERLCLLIDEVIAPLPLQKGKPHRQDYHYKRNGVCHLFTCFEPLTGQRFIESADRRTKTDYSAFMEKVEQRYRRAETIVVIQDNLNTHDPGSFYASRPPEQAFALSRRFEFHYTPPHAAWLNMVEIELSCLVRQCLDRRIPDRITLNQEVQRWAHKRNQERTTVRWQFTPANARDAFKRFYPQLS